MLTQLHPYVVHFPVALLLISVVLFFLGKAGGSRTWASAVLSAARWNLWLGSPIGPRFDHLYHKGLGPRQALNWWRDFEAHEED